MCQMLSRIKGVITDIDKPEIEWIKLDNFNVQIEFNPSYNLSRIYQKTNEEVM